MSDERDTPGSPNRLGPPWDNPAFDLLILVVLILLALAGRAKRIVRPTPVAPTIRLAEPQLSALSESDAAEAAHLLGSSLAGLWTAGGETTP